MYDDSTLISVIALGDPVAWARARLDSRGRGRIFTPDRQKNAAMSFKWTARQAMGTLRPFAGPLKVDLTFAYARPKSMAKSDERVFKTSRPDLDNLVKLVCDAGNQLIWIDDAQIVELTTRKLYSNPPRTELHVRMA